MNNKLIKNEDEINNIFDNIKELVLSSRNRVYTTVNTEMLNLYWNIGKAIMEIQQGDERASYGETVLEKLSQKLTAEFGKGFSKRNLERMRKFYIYFPIATTVSSQLSWSHYLELLKVDTIVFDKTGTLPYGKLKISKIINYTNIENNKLLQMVGSIEAKSIHPIGNAFTDYLAENKIETLNVENFENITGLGLRATINNDEILIGNAKILLKYQIKNRYEEDEKKISEDGNSIVYVVRNKEIIALIGVNDIVRENAKEVIESLNKNKVQTIMITGDNNQTAEKIAKDIGIKKVIANVLPSEKAKIELC